jgi:hypothetical protein
MHCGDACPNCGTGRIKVLNTFPVGASRIQYLGCNRCGWRPPSNKVVVRSRSNREAAVNVTASHVALHYENEN